MGRIYLMCQYMTGGVFQFPATPLYPKLPEATPPPPPPPPPPSDTRATNTIVSPQIVNKYLFIHVTLLSLCQ